MMSSTYNVYVFCFPVEIDPCENQPCKNGATCVKTEEAFSCMCSPGYTDVLCDTDIDECSSSPCTMGGQCVDMVNGFHCNCPRLLGGVSVYER